MTARQMLAGVRKAYASKGDDVTFSRWVKIPGARHAKPKQGVLLGLGHPTVEAGRSIFYRKGLRAAEDGSVLVSGYNNVKIGRDVRKGKFRGYWIYTLSLEERATCPRSCHHWHDCYGNGMPWAKRVDHRDDAALQAAIETDIKRLLAVRGRPGILVRLHALGDFYSEEYVQFWQRMMEEHPKLAVFGYTARIWHAGIGEQVELMRYRFPGRWMVRFSDQKLSSMATVSITDRADCPPNAFVCPEQTGQTKGCGTCGACWSTTKNVAFLSH